MKLKINSLPLILTIIILSFSFIGCDKSKEEIKPTVTTSNTLTSLRFSFKPSTANWSDSLGNCFEPSCDTLNARIYFYNESSKDSVYKTPILSFGKNSKNEITIITEKIILTDEKWNLKFIHEYSSGAGLKFAEFNFNPAKDNDNGSKAGIHEIYIGFSSLSLSLYYEKLPN